MNLARFPLRFAGILVTTALLEFLLSVTPSLAANVNAGKLTFMLTFVSRQAISFCENEWHTKLVFIDTSIKCRYAGFCSVVCAADDKLFPKNSVPAGDVKLDSAVRTSRGFPLPRASVTFTVSRNLQEIRLECFYCAGAEKRKFLWCVCVLLSLSYWHNNKLACLRNRTALPAVLTESGRDHM